MRVVDGVKTVCLLDRREYVTLFGMTFVVHPLSLSLAFFFLHSSPPFASSFEQQRFPPPPHTHKKRDRASS